MSRSTLLTFCYLIAHAIRACNSQWSGSTVLRPTNPKYTSCPSCRHDCPAALSSPWYYTPVSRETRYVRSREIEYDPRMSSMEPIPQRQYRSPWYATLNPPELYIDSESRNVALDFQSGSIELDEADCHGDCPCRKRGTNSYQRDRRNYGPSYGSSERWRDFELDSAECEDDCGCLYGGYFRRDVNSVINGENDVARDPSRKVLLVYGSNEEEEVEEEVGGSEERRYSVIGSLPFRGSSGWLKRPVFEKIARRNPANAEIQMQLLRSDEISPERQDYMDEFQFSKIDYPTEPLYTPEIKYNPYNLSPDLNILKMIEKMETPVLDSIQPQDRKILDRKSGERNALRIVSDDKKIAFAGKLDETLKDNEQETRVEETSSTTITSNENTQFYEPNPDFINDMENPSLVSTEPTPKASFTE